LKRHYLDEAKLVLTKNEPKGVKATILINNAD